MLEVAARRDPRHADEWSLGLLMVAFYITSGVFVVGVLGTLLYAVTRINIFSLMKYLGRGQGIEERS